METFAAIAITLYVAHHVGDYWVQTDHQARHKGAAGAEGRIACLVHVATYTLTQLGLLVVIMLTLGVHVSPLGLWLGLGVSAATHYTADRREHGLMFKLARMIPGKADFLKLGVPRKLRVDARWVDETYDAVLDNPSLGTGAWALDQSWHLFFGVFVAGLLIALV